ncbi:salicylate hydroxylase [Sphingobium sp. SCG-1]|uniref:3-hydroxybenzoate 6-monooxygenase n=1 Tax=Sphingobium sp. SCG-1 TaxID=2072936 RepID=UPI000CD6B4EA|nr:3-hydroxybenzoate 6-monooxygenase [Sphingobium sp. SCG-1]AUW57091.1 salicylate hydroxylase [Sphingobium sp. SCG-1]
MSITGRIAIVGGGIGGLATARALSLAGWQSVVLEQAPQFEEVGAGIQIGPNGFRLLESLGLRDAVAAAAVFPDNLIVMDGVSAEEVTRVPVGSSAFRDRFTYPYALIHRADLHQALVDACEADERIELRAGVQVSGYTDDGSKVQIGTAAGATIEADGIVGADGLWSMTRQALLGDGPPRVSGHIAYRAVLPIEAVEERFRKNDMILWAGPRNHLVQYPLRGSKLFNLVAVFHSDRYVEGWDRQGDPEELKHRFAGNCDIVRTLLSKVETWRMWVLCDREPAKFWHKGRSALVGDAAHPMLQYLAQGASMALEDSVILAQEVQKSPEDLSSAFARYSTLRYLRTGRCQIMARIYGGFYHAEGVSRELATRFLQSRNDAESFESLAWLYDFDPGSVVKPRII